MSLSFGDLGFGAGPFGGFADPLPALTVEVAFDTDPLDAVPVWTDITAWVDARSSMSWRRGRGSDNESVQPGTLSLTLDNSDGRFTAGNTASPYYPNVTINRRIRVTAVHDGVTYYLFDGHVDRWPVAWQGGVRALAAVSATDRTKLLARRPIRTLLEEEVLRDSPVGLYPMQEPSGASSVGEVSRANSVPAALAQSKYGGGGFEFGADGPNNYTALALNCDTSTVALDREGYYVDLGGTSAPHVTRDADGMSVEFWVRCSSAGNDALPAVGTQAYLWSMFTRTWSSATSEDYDGVSLQVVAGALVAQVYGNSGLSYGEFGGSTNIADGRWHHVVMVASTSITTTFYVDGAVEGTLTSSPVGLNALRQEMLFGRSPGRDYLTQPDYAHFRGMVAGLAVFDVALTAGQVAEHHRLGVPDDTELSSARVERLAAYADIPTGTVETGRSNVSNRQDTAGKGVNVALQDVATSEDGLVFLDGQGRLTFHSRSHRMNQASSFTLDASADEVEADLQFEMSDAVMLNDIAVDRPRGGPVRTVDQASVDTFGTYAEQVSTLLTTDQETQAFGQWQTSRRSTPAPRAGRVSVDPFTNPDLYPAALGTELGTRFTLSGLPDEAPASSVTLIVEGVEHTVSIDGWRTTWDTSPADDTAYMRWDVDTWDNARWAW